MKLIAFNSQLAVLPTDNNQDSSGKGEETDDMMDQDQNQDSSDGDGEGSDDSDETEENGDGSGDSEKEGETSEDSDGESGDGSEDGENGDSSEGENGDEGSDGEEGEGSEGETSESDQNSSDKSDSSDREGYDGNDSGENTIDLRDMLEDLKQGFEDLKGERDAGGSDFVDKEDNAQREAMAEMLEELLNQMEDAEESDIDLKGHNEAFTEHFDGLGDDLLENEQYWRPYFADNDEVRIVRKGNKGTAQRYRNSVRGEVAAITTKLRSKFLMARSKKVIHGTRAGTLSDRRLVSSMVEIKSGRRPTRPNFQEQNKQDCSLAVGLVIDQSGSMRGDNQVYAAKGAIAIAEPLDKLGAPVMVCGPRDGRWNYGDTEDDQEIRENTGYYSEGPDKYHRTNSVVVDIFKDWGEKMNMCLDRFSNVSACGGTPLSDGIQYAMQELSERPERHRVIIVLTDGAANCPLVVNRQIRLAKEAGIHVIGVGIGSYCSSVEYQFPENNIQIPNVKELPKQLLSILDGIMFPTKSKKARMDGRIGK